MGSEWAHMASEPTLLLPFGLAPWPQRRPPGHSYLRRPHRAPRHPGTLSGVGKHVKSPPEGGRRGMQKQKWIRIRTGPMCPRGWGTAQAQDVSSTFPERLRPRWGPRAAAPAPWQTGAAAPREAPAAPRRRADCHTACESRRLAAAPAPSCSGVAGTRAPRLALCGGQRRTVRLGCFPGQVEQPSDPSRGQAGMKCELHRLTPFLGHSTSTSKPLGCFGDTRYVLRALEEAGRLGGVTIDPRTAGLRIPRLGGVSLQKRLWWGGLAGRRGQAEAGAGLATSEEEGRPSGLGGHHFGGQGNGGGLWQGHCAMPQFKVGPPGLSPRKGLKGTPGPT